MGQFSLTKKMFFPFFGHYLLWQCHATFLATAFVQVLSFFSFSSEPILLISIKPFFFLFIHEWNLIRSSNISTDHSLQTTCSSCSVSQNAVENKYLLSHKNTRVPVSFTLIKNGKFPLCAWLSPHYLAPAHSHCFSYVKVANISAPEPCSRSNVGKTVGQEGKWVLKESAA